MAEFAVRVVAAPYFIAFKIEAFLNRGRGDYLASHDLEDLVIVVDGRAAIVDEVRQGTSPAVRRFIASHLTRMWDRLVSETIPGALLGDGSRCALVESRLAAICALGDSRGA